MSANVSICNFCFSIGEEDRLGGDSTDKMSDSSNGEKKDTYPPRKGDVTVTVVQDSRVIGTKASGKQLGIEKIKFKFYKSGYFGEKLSMGIKAMGIPEEIAEGDGLQCSAWGDINKLKEWIKTSLTNAELMAFLLFCTQWSTSAKWLVVCMRDYMFPSEDSDYYSEEEIQSGYCSDE